MPAVRFWPRCKRFQDGVLVTLLEIISTVPLTGEDCQRLIYLTCEDAHILLRGLGAKPTDRSLFRSP